LPTSNAENGDHRPDGSEFVTTVAAWQLKIERETWMMSEYDTRVPESWSARANSRYHSLLKLSNAIAADPSTGDMLRNVRQVLSELLAIDAVLLVRLEEDNRTARLLALDQKAAMPKVDPGASIKLIGSATGQALAKMEPVFIPDLNQAMLVIPDLAGQASFGLYRCAYVFPIATPRVRLGALVFASAENARFSKEDVELMASAATQVAVALESEMAAGEAARYRQQVQEERDRLELLLDINNQIVTKKDLNELFQSASATIRKYFGNDCAGFWLRDGESHQFECAVLDFPSRINPQEENPVLKPGGSDLERMGDRIPRIWTEEHIAAMSAPLLRALKAESIKSLISAPLVTAQGVVGMIALGSRQPHYFNQADLELLLQVENQMSLALENAIAYGRLDAFKNRLQAENLYLESEICSELSLEDIVGDSPTFRKVLDKVAVVAPTRSTVLLHGETGTGKELIARAIHNASPRQERTFVKLNCAAIPSALIESELFGHEKGAFTGAFAQRRGRFEVADHGTLFLDEVGDIALELQPKLLRAIQEQEFERVGSNRTIRVDVRFVAATHQDLKAMIRENRFREDLFYRLNVFPIEIPPLRERREDIPLLVHYFVSRLSREMQKTIRRIPRDAMDALTNAPWPGNVRELENFIERAVILTNGEDLQVSIKELEEPALAGMQAGATRAATTLRESERRVILDALKASSWKVAGPGGAAERLGLKRSTLRNKMHRLNISRSMARGYRVWSE
jgi:formate hydrogenlyase transcriptional activator